MKWSAIQQLLQSMQSNLDCPICLEIMKNPVSTVCNHNFCKFCIYKFLDTKRCVLCPLCKVRLTKRGLQENVKLENIIDKVKNLVSAIEKDTGWTYSQANKKPSLQAKGASTKRKIFNNDESEEVVDETNMENIRLGKRRKSVDNREKDENSLCYETPQSGVSSVKENISLSNRQGSQPCPPSGHNPSNSGVSPTTENQRIPLISKNGNSFCQEWNTGSGSSKNLRSMQVWSGSECRSSRGSLVSGTVESKKLETVFNGNCDSLSRMLCKIDKFKNHSIENTSVVNSSCKESLLVKDSVTNKRYNFRKNTRHSMKKNDTLGFGDSFSSAEGQKKVATLLQNVEKSKEFKTPPKLNNSTILYKINKSCSRNIRKFLVFPANLEESHSTVDSSQDCIDLVEILKRSKTDDKSDQNRCSSNGSQQTDSGLTVTSSSLTAHTETLPKTMSSESTKLNKCNVSSESISHCFIESNRNDDNDDCKKFKMTLETTGPSCGYLPKPRQAEIKKAEESAFNVECNENGKKPIKSNVECNENGKKPIKSNVECNENGKKPIKSNVECNENGKKPIKSNVECNENGKKPIKSNVEYNENGKKPIKSDVECNENGKKPIKSNVKCNENGKKPIKSNVECNENGKKPIKSNVEYNENGKKPIKSNVECNENGKKPIKSDVEYNENGKKPIKSNVEYNENGKKPIKSNVECNENGKKPIKSDVEYNENGKKPIKSNVECNENGKKPIKSNVEYNENGKKPIKSNVECNENGKKPIKSDVEFNENGKKPIKSNVEYNENGKKPIKSNVECNENGKKPIKSNVECNENGKKPIKSNVECNENGKKPIKSNVECNENGKKPIKSNVEYNENGKKPIKSNVEYNENGKKPIKINVECNENGKKPIKSNVECNENGKKPIKSNLKNNLEINSLQINSICDSGLKTNRTKQKSDLSSTSKLLDNQIGSDEDNSTNLKTNSSEDGLLYGSILGNTRRSKINKPDVLLEHSPVQSAHSNISSKDSTKNIQTNKFDMSPCSMLATDNKYDEDNSSLKNIDVLYVCRKNKLHPHGNTSPKVSTKNIQTNKCDMSPCSMLATDNKYDEDNSSLKNIDVLHVCRKNKLHSHAEVPKQRPGKRNFLNLKVDYSSDSDDCKLIVEKSVEELFFKWNSEADKLKTYSRRSSCNKNRFKILKWLKYLPERFSQVEEQIINEEDCEFGDEEVPGGKSQNGSFDSSPYVSISQMDNNSNMAEDKNPGVCKKSLSLRKSDKISELRNNCSERLKIAQETENGDFPLCQMKSLSPNHTKIDLAEGSQKSSCRRMQVPETGIAKNRQSSCNVPVNVLEEKNLITSESSGVIDAAKKPLKIAKNGNGTLERSSLSENTPACKSLSLKNDQGIFDGCFDSSNGKTIPKDHFEFVESPKPVKFQSKKKKKGKKSLKKMPELSFQNRFTRSFQKRLGFRKKASRIAPKVSRHLKTLLKRHKGKILTTKELTCSDLLVFETQVLSKNSRCPNKESVNQEIPEEVLAKEKPGIKESVILETEFMPEKSVGILEGKPVKNLVPELLESSKKKECLQDGVPNGETSLDLVPYKSNTISSSRLSEKFLQLEKAQRAYCIDQINSSTSAEQLSTKPGNSKKINPNLTGQKYLKNSSKIKKSIESIPEGVKYPEASLEIPKLHSSIMAGIKSSREKIVVEESLKLKLKNPDNSHKEEEEDISKNSQRLNLIKPVTVGYDKKLPGQKRRWKRLSKVKNELLEQEEILALEKQIKSAEEHRFLFNSQDVRHSFDQMVPDQSDKDCGVIYANGNQATKRSKEMPQSGSENVTDHINIKNGTSSFSKRSKEMPQSGSENVTDHINIKNGTSSFSKRSKEMPQSVSENVTDHINIKNGTSSFSKRSKEMPQSVSENVTDHINIKNGTSSFSKRSKEMPQSESENVTDHINIKNGTSNFSKGSNEKPQSKNITDNNKIKDDTSNFSKGFKEMPQNVRENVTDHIDIKNSMSKFSYMEESSINNNRNKAEGTSRKPESIKVSGFNIEETKKGSSKTLCKNDWSETFNIAKDRLLDNFASIELSIKSSKTMDSCSADHHNIKPGINDEFLKPAEINTFKDSLNPLKSDPCKSAAVSVGLTNKKLVGIKTHKHKENKSEDISSKIPDDSSDKTVIDLLRNNPKPSDSSFPVSLKRTELVDAKTLTVSPLTNALQKRGLNSNAFPKNQPPFSTDSPNGLEGTFLNKVAVNLISSVILQEKKGSGSKFYVNNQERNITAPETLNVKHGKSLESISINGKTFEIIDSTPLFLFQENLKNFLKVDSCLDLLKTPRYVCQMDREEEGGTKCQTLKNPNVPVMTVSVTPTIMPQKDLEEEGVTKCQPLKSANVPVMTVSVTPTIMPQNDLEEEGVTKCQPLKSANVPVMTVSVTPTIIPESPFSDLALVTTLRTESMQRRQQTNWNRRRLGNKILIRKTKNFQDDNNNNNESEKVRILCNSSSAHLKGGLCFLKGSESSLFEGEELRNDTPTDSTEPNRLLSSEKTSDFPIAKTKRMVSAVCSEFHDAKVSSMDDCGLQKAKEFGEITAKISPQRKLLKNSNLRFCARSVPVLSDNSELSYEEWNQFGSEVNNSQRWMNEDLFPLDPTNEITDPTHSEPLLKKAPKFQEIQSNLNINNQGACRNLDLQKSLENQEKDIFIDLTEEYTAQSPPGKSLALKDIHCKTMKKFPTDIDDKESIERFLIPLQISPKKSAINDERPVILADHLNLKESPDYNRPKTSVSAEPNLPFSSPLHCRNSSKRRSSLRTRSKTIGPSSSRENTDDSIEDSKESSVSSDVTSVHSNLQPNLELQDEKLCESLASPCQILCYSTESSKSVENPKIKELSSGSKSKRVALSRTCKSNVQESSLSNLRLVDYEISQNSLSDSDTSQSSGRKTRSSSRLRSQLSKNAQPCKTELKSPQDAKRKNPSTLENSRLRPQIEKGQVNTTQVGKIQVSGKKSAVPGKSRGIDYIQVKNEKVIENCSGDNENSSRQGSKDSSEDSNLESLPKDPKKEGNVSQKDESSMEGDSWLTVTDNFDLLTQGRTEESFPDELSFLKSGTAKREMENLLMSENLSLTSSERRLLRSGIGETEEFSNQTENKNPCTVGSETDAKERTVMQEEMVISSEEMPVVSFDQNTKMEDFDKEAKSSQNMNSLAPSQIQISGTMIDENSLSENTLEPTPLPFPNSVKSTDHSDFAFKDQDISTVCKMQPVPPPESLIKNKSLKNDIQKTQILDANSDTVIPDSLEPIPVNEELENVQIVKTLAPNANMSQTSRSSYVPCSVEQDGNLTHVLEPFHDFYSMKYKESVLDNDRFKSKNQDKETNNNSNKSKETDSFIPQVFENTNNNMAESSSKNSSQRQTIPDSKIVQGTPNSNKVQECLQEVEVIQESPICSTATIPIPSRVSFSTECHLKIDSQNFIPVKKSKRKCFSLGLNQQDPVPQLKGKEKGAENSIGLLEKIPIDLFNCNNECSLLAKKDSSTLIDSPKKCLANRKPLSQTSNFENSHNNKPSVTNLFVNSVLADSNSSESCVLVSNSQLNECSYNVPKGGLFDCPPTKKNHLPVIEQVYLSGSDPDPHSEPRFDKEALESVNTKKSSIKGQAEEFLKRTDSNSNVEESTRMHLSLVKDAIKSSPGNKVKKNDSSKTQNERKFSGKANSELNSLEPKDLQENVSFKKSDSSKVITESVNSSPTGSDTQQPSCSLLTQSFELETEVKDGHEDDDEDDDDNTVATEPPSLSFSELDSAIESQQGETVDPMAGHESCLSQIKEGFKNNGCIGVVENRTTENNLSGNVLDTKQEEAKCRQESLDASARSGSTKYLLVFSDPSPGALHCQKANPSPINREAGVKDPRLKAPQVDTKDEKSKKESGESVFTENSLELELDLRSVKEKRVLEGSTNPRSNERLEPETRNGQRQEKYEEDNIDCSLPDLPPTYPQGFCREMISEEDQEKTLIVQKQCEESSNKAVAPVDPNHSNVRLECDSDKERRTQANDDAIIVIDELPNKQAVPCDVKDDITQQGPLNISETESRLRQAQILRSPRKTVENKFSFDNDSNIRKNIHLQKREEEENGSQGNLSGINIKKSECDDIVHNLEDDGPEEVPNLESNSASSPSALSTQNEKISTQQCTYLEQDLEEMKRQIAHLEAKLGLDDSSFIKNDDDDDDDDDDDEENLRQIMADQKFSSLDDRDVVAKKETKINEDTRKPHCDEKYIRLSSSSSDDDDDDRKVIPDSDPDPDPENRNVEQNVSNVFPVQSRAITDLTLSPPSGEESEDLFCTPESPSHLPLFTAPCLSGSTKAGKGAEAGVSAGESPARTRSQSKRKRSERNESLKLRRRRRRSKRRIESSGDDDDDDDDSPKSLVERGQKSKAKKDKVVRTPRISEEKLSSEDASQSPSGDCQRPARKKPARTLLRAKQPSPNKSSLVIFKESSRTNTSKNAKDIHSYLSSSPAECQVKDSSLKSSSLKGSSLKDSSLKDSSLKSSSLKDSSLKKAKFFIATGLSNIEVNQVKKLASSVDGHFLLKFSKDVTHVIVKTVSDNVRYCERTLKYFQGIANKSWILSYKWIQDSLENKRLQKEESYEIIGDAVNGLAHRGPTRSRLSHRPLFKQFEFCVVGESPELPQDDMKNLVEMVGGRIVSNPKDFSSKANITCLAIAVSNESLKQFKNLRGQMKNYNVLLVSREWVLDSVATYRAQPLEGYILLS